MLVVKMAVTNYLNICLKEDMLVVKMVVTNYLNIDLEGNMFVVKMAVTNCLNIGLKGGGGDISAHKGNLNLNYGFHQ